ncbi:MAG: PAS domain-containing protein [Acidobacteria bacterium]|nr:PAS domain-containing protein [Acidobacteriota bacterium]
MSARGSKDYSRGILDHLLEGCQIIGPDWRYLYVNDAVVHHSRKDRGALVGHRMMDVFPGIEQTPMFATLQRVMEGRVPAVMTNEFVYPDGQSRWFDLRAQPVPEGIFVLSWDVTEQRAAQSTIDTQLRRLRALRAIDRAILGTVDLDLAFRTILDETRTLLGADIVNLKLLNPTTLMLETAAAAGHEGSTPLSVAIKVGEGASGTAALERRTVAVPTLDGSSIIDAPLREALRAEGVQAIHAVPLIARGTVIGVLNVMHRAPFTASADWIDFLEALAGQTAIAIESGRAVVSLQRAHLDLQLAYDATIEGWSRALDLRDHQTEGHTRRVTETTVAMARLAGMSEEQLVHVKRGALLHDIGKIGIPDSVLLKPGPLTDEEWSRMRQHPTYAYELLFPVAHLRPALDIPYCHHEKWDGSGYPRGLKGESIPLAAHLFAVADVYDALRYERPYRESWPEDRVHDFLRQKAGTHFDPAAVELFFKATAQSPQ